MKALRLIAVTIVLVLTLTAARTYAEVSGSASAGVFSNYVWRGQKLSNSIVVQPSVGITYEGFGANLWANYDTDYTDQGELTETDLTLNYTFSYDKFSFDVGYIYYGLEGADDTQELYASVAYDMLLSPTITVYYDYDEGEGAFVVVSLGHSFELPAGMTLSIGASASYNIENKVMGTDSNGDEFSDFYNGEVSAAVSIPVTKAISIEPMVAYSFPLSNDAEDAIEAISDDGDDNILYGGITVTLSF